MPRRRLISGGGIAGLTAALLLQREGMYPVVTEKHAGVSPQPKARRFNPRSTEVFRLLGLAAEVAKASAPPASFTEVLAARRWSPRGCGSWAAPCSTGGGSRRGFPS